MPTNDYSEAQKEIDKIDWGRYKTMLEYENKNPTSEKPKGFFSLILGILRSWFLK
ncbi:MAG: hypothetical protein NTW69_06275 [Chloroflexi bacterium]|nr:hypothetical protein [Chloroflexota bacterium]